MTVLSNNDPEPGNAAEPLVGPGARLRKQRESLGLDQSRVAAQLHLSEAMVEALEWDDFDALPGSVFTQGYLRNYARLLNLPESEILAAYQHLVPGDQQEHLSTKGTVTLKQEVRSSHGLVRLVSWSIALGLLVLLYFWWQGRFGWQEDTLVDLLPEVDSLDQPLDLDEPLAEPSVIVQSAEDYSSDSISLAAEPIPRVEFPEPSERIPDDRTESLPVVEEAPVPEEPEIAVAEQPTVPFEDTVQSVAELEPVAPAKPEASGKLVFEFDGPCWAEVRDATGRARIHGEKRAGFRQEIDTDLGPFKIVLGDASVVRVTLDGESYDLAPHTRGNVARFVLNPE
ncbi:MAG: helix-turn-helix domain-containing protein [Gammaproteobacteria bacterium]|nr:helix-turn-helix domain-containing protein [Gammaproteobacteria bacterium]